MKKSDGKRISGIISNSRVLSFFDKLCTGAHEKVKTGLFARLFCSYPEGKKVKQKLKDHEWLQKILGIEDEIAKNDEMERLGKGKKWKRVKKPEVVEDE